MKQETFLKKTALLKDYLQQILAATGSEEPGRIPSTLPMAAENK